MSVCLLVRPPARLRVCLPTWNNSASTRRSFMKFDIIFRISIKFEFHLTVTKIMCTLHEDLCKYSRTPLIRINWVREPSGYAVNPDKWISLWILATLAVWSGGKKFYKWLHIYVCANKNLIHNSLYVFDKWAETLSHKNMQYNYSTKMFTRRASRSG